MVQAQCAPSIVPVPRRVAAGQWALGCAGHAAAALCVADEGPLPEVAGPVTPVHSTERGVSFMIIQLQLCDIK
jgi:hypothetical protein